MKKKTKRILGSCGLLGVVAMTAVAVFLPTPGTPEAAATGSYSTTDTVTVKVISGNPEVSIINPSSGGVGIENGAVVADANISFDIDYSSVLEPTITVDYRNLQGQERTELIFKKDVGYADEVETVSFNLFDLTPVNGAIGVIDTEHNGLSLAKTNVEAINDNNTVARMDVSEVKSKQIVNYAINQRVDEAMMRLTASEGSGEIPFGYGWYRFTLRGTGIDGESAIESSLYFTFIPLTASYTEEDGKYTLHLAYEYDDPALYNGAHGVRSVDVKVYDEETGELIWNQAYSDGTKNVALPFELSKKIKEYRIEITPYGRDSAEPMSDPVVLEISTAAIVIPSTGVEVDAPDTGIFGGKLNISKIDYLITGLVVFGIVVVAGFVFVLKGGKQKTKRK